MSERQWRAFVGVDLPDDGWAHLNQGGLTWEEARDTLAAHLAPFRTDQCTDCRQQGTQALDTLLSAQPGTEFSDEIDGETYAVTRT